MAAHTTESAPGLARAVAANTLWGAAGRLLGGFFAFGTLAFLSRSMGPDGYGGYATVLAFFFLFNALADGGLYNILVRDIGRPGVDPRRLLATAASLRLFFLGAAFGIGILIFIAIPSYRHLAAWAPLAIVSYAALSFGQLLMAVLQKHLIVFRATVAEVVARSGQFLAVAALFFFGIQSIGAFLAVLAAASVLQALLILRAVSGVLPFRIRTTRADARLFLREALPVAFALLFTLIYFRLDTVLLSLLRPPADVGIYNLSYKILEQLIFFPAMFIGILTPILSRAFVEDRRRFLALFRRASGIIAMGALPLAVGGWFLADALILLLGGDAFLAAVVPLRALLLATVLIFFGTLLGSSVIIAGKQRQAIPVYALGMAVNLIGNLAFIPTYSYMASAWATVVTEAVIVLGLAALLWRNGIRFAVPNAARIFGATAVMAVPLALLAQRAMDAIGAWSLLPFLVFCPLLYAAVLLALKVVSREDLALLRAR